MIVKGFVLALLLLAQFVPSGPRAPVATSGISYVGTCDAGGSGVTTETCTYATVPGGATLAIGASGSVAPTGVSDSIAGSATQVGSNLTFNTTYVGNLWYIKNATLGSHAITVTFSGLTNAARLKVMVFSGANATTPIDPFTAGQGVGSGTFSPAVTSSFTTTNANEMIAGFVWGVGGPTPISTSAPYTLVIGTSTVSMASLYGIQATAGSYTTSVTMSGSGTWGTMAMALKQ